MSEFTQRSEMLIGAEALEKIVVSRVAIFGLGGVGGAAVEALARLGVGTFYLVDADCFAPSNLNRQILSTQQAIGKKKTEVAKQRILSISPKAEIHCFDVFFSKEDTQVPFEIFDFVIDAIDTVSAKVEIIRRCHDLNIPMVSCMGCGNRFDPSKLTLTDIYKTLGDPLAKVMRQKCREIGIKKMDVVCSTEEPTKPLFSVASDSPTRRDVPGSMPFVPPAAGYLLAYCAFLRLAGIKTGHYR